MRRLYFCLVMFLLVGCNAQELLPGVAVYPTISYPYEVDHIQGVQLKLQRIGTTIDYSLECLDDTMVTKGIQLAVDIVHGQSVKSSSVNHVGTQKCTRSKQISPKVSIGSLQSDMTNDFLITMTLTITAEQSVETMTRRLKVQDGVAYDLDSYNVWP